MMEAVNIEIPRDWSTRRTREIITIMSGRNPDYLDGFLGIDLFQKADQRPEGEDCFRFLFGSSQSSKDVERLLGNETRLMEPQPGVLALYDDGYNTCHIGIVLPDKRIRSKWGSWAVYDHPPILVPVFYGRYIEYHKLPPEIKLQTGTN